MKAVLQHVAGLSPSTLAISTTRRLCRRYMSIYSNSVDLESGPPVGPEIIVLSWNRCWLWARSIYQSVGYASV